MGKIDELSKTNRTLNANQNCFFVTNTIMYANVDDESESDSSDESLDSDLENFDFDFENVEQHPFRAEKSGSDVIDPSKLYYFSQTQNESKMILPFLNKLESTGLENNSNEKISDLISSVIFLNRPLSLSSRKNKILIKEFTRKSEASKIKHKIIAGFWSIIWKDKNKDEVDYSRVRKFYKRYKKCFPEKAKKFRELNEESNQNIQVPYQVLREFAKNHDSTKEFIRDAKEKSKHVYLSFVDGDTVSFNGIYSSYLGLYRNSNTIIPTVMSTGYEYSSEVQSDRPFIEASKLDRIIRTGIAEIFPQGVYYPEPNFCILVLDDKNCIEESFIDKKRDDNRLESAIILGNLLRKRGDKLWIFASENPVLIEIPERVRLIKNHKKIKIEFSSEFQKLIRQSSTDGLTIAKNLYINRGISLVDPNSFNREFNDLLNSVRPIYDKEYDDLRVLLKYDEDIFNKIKQIITKVKAIKSNYKIRYTRLDELEDYLESHKDPYDRGFLETIAKYDNVVDDIINGKIFINEIQNACEVYGHSLKQVLEKTNENSLHLKFMSENPTDVIYENLHDKVICKFGHDNYAKYIDYDYVFIENIIDNYENDSVDTE
ncbi:unnamed protein product [Brachionus calyciflorus]|uniref:Uncharacterized protein n=1 Tax=Brachionus calyciflorus TaxID=104777 RepID=A0A814GDW1_9BILA|nr:unnamed protein product [Brachionus calyciflorus]